jgi:hypothetical protein
MESIKNKSLKKVLSLLNSQKVSKVIAGGSNGSIIILDIDNRYSLCVYCVWRLEHGDKVLTGWNESNDSKSGNLTLGIKKLEGDTIKRIYVNQFYDLQISFYSGKVLNIFCDITPKYEPEECDENWSLADIIKNEVYTITKSYLIATELYSKNEK